MKVKYWTERNVSGDVQFQCGMEGVCCTECFSLNQFQ